MTTNLEPGPELDKRVAEAMGQEPLLKSWNYETETHEPWAPPYSTELKLVGEMMEWLPPKYIVTKQREKLYILFDQVAEDCPGDHWVFELKPLGEYESRNLALCAAVLAVGERSMR